MRSIFTDGSKTGCKPNITNEKAAFGRLFLCYGDNQNKQKHCTINKNSVEFSHGRKPNKQSGTGLRGAEIKMKAYKKSKTITLDGDEYKITGWDIAGYINSRGVSIEKISAKNGEKSEGVLLRFNHFSKGESGKRIFMEQCDYDKIAENYDPYDDLNTWTMPFLNYIESKGGCLK